MVGSLPVSYKLGSTFHRKAIEALCPELANIRWDKTNRPLNAGLKWPERYPALAARLNVKPSWGKSSNAMFNYESLLSSELLGGLFSHFKTVGYSSVTIEMGFEQLLSGPSSLHCKGVARSLAIFEDEYTSTTKGAAA